MEINSIIALMPKEIWLKILLEIDGRSLLSLGVVCKFFFELSSDNKLWSILCKKILPVCHFKLTNGNAKSYFNKYLRSANKDLILVIDRDINYLCTPDGQIVSTRKDNEFSPSVQSCWSPLSDKIATVSIDNTGYTIKICSVDSFGDQKTEEVIKGEGFIIYILWTPDNLRVVGLKTEIFNRNLVAFVTTLVNDSTFIIQGSPLYLAHSPFANEDNYNTYLCHVDTFLYIINLVDNSLCQIEVPGYRQGHYLAPVWTPENKIICSLVSMTSGKTILVAIDGNKYDESEIKERNLHGRKTNNIRTYQHFTILYESDKEKIEDSKPIRFILSHNGRYVAISTPCREIWIYDLSNNKTTKIVTKDVSQTISMFFSPDSKYLLTLQRWLRNLNQWQTINMETIFNNPLNGVEGLFKYSFHVASSVDDRVYPFFEQYHLNVTPFSPDSKKFVYVSDHDIFVQEVEKLKSNKLIGKGMSAWWSTTKPLGSFKE